MQGRQANSAAETLLQQALTTYRNDPLRGDFLIHYACASASDPLPLQRIAYKFYNRQRRFARAYDFAACALGEAARRAGLADDFNTWRRESLLGLDADLSSHILLALKALAFLSLRMGEGHAAHPYLACLARLDPEDGSGASVIEALFAAREVA